MTASPWVIRGCRGCGTAMRVLRAVDKPYCSEYCRRVAATAKHTAVIATTPLHVLYPEMMQVLTWAQERRRSPLADE